MIFEATTGVFERNYCFNSLFQEKIIQSSKSETWNVSLEAVDKKVGPSGNPPHTAINSFP